MRFERLKEIVLSLGVSDFSVLNAIDINIDFKLPDDIPCDMYYLKKPQRYNIKEFFKEVKSVLICIYQYWHPGIDYDKKIKEIRDPYEFLSKKYKNIEYLKSIRKEDFKIARYALVDEYHRKIKDNLNKILFELKKEDEKVAGKVFVDTSSVFEKPLAASSQLGFIGRNTLLIHPEYGSFLFIGGIAVNIEIEGVVKRDVNFKKICDECRLCETSCPFKALKDYRLDPLKCVSYWTTHNKRSQIPPQIIEKSNYIFGCDICQEVCPYNYRAVKKESIFYNSSF